MFGNLIKLVLIASGLAIILKSFFQQIIFLLPLDLFSFKTWLGMLISGGVPFILGLLVFIVIGFLLSLHQRYKFGFGFILLFLATGIYLVIELYHYEILHYFMQSKDHLLQGVKFKIYMEISIQLLSIIGLLLIYRSRLPEEIDWEHEERDTP